MEQDANRTQTTGCERLRCKREPVVRFCGPQALVHEVKRRERRDLQSVQGSSPRNRPPGPNTIEPNPPPHCRDQSSVPLLRREGKPRTREQLSKHASDAKEPPRTTRTEASSGDPSHRRQRRRCLLSVNLLHRPTTAQPRRINQDTTFCSFRPRSPRPSNHPEAAALHPPHTHTRSLCLYRHAHRSPSPSITARAPRPTIPPVNHAVRQRPSPQDPPSPRELVPLAPRVVSTTGHATRRTVLNEKE